PDLLSFSREARLLAPVMQRRRNLENCVVRTLLVRGSRLAFRATMCRADGDLEVCWNRILTIFDPYTFSHSQGHERASRALELLVDSSSAWPPEAEVLYPTAARDRPAS